MFVVTLAVYPPSSLLVINAKRRTILRAKELDSYHAGRSLLIILRIILDKLFAITYPSLQDKIGLLAAIINFR